MSVVKRPGECTNQEWQRVMERLIGSGRDIDDVVPPAQVLLNELRAFIHVHSDGITGPEQLYDGNAISAWAAIELLNRLDQIEEARCASA